MQSSPAVDDEVCQSGLGKQYRQAVSLVLVVSFADVYRRLYLLCVVIVSLPRVLLLYNSSTG